jgi:phosphoglycolate phosphatase-like HAD superfamily hydrolase
LTKKISLFWDIDGTILSTKGAGLTPFLDAIIKRFPDCKPITRKECSGKTDYEIIMGSIGHENWTNQDAVDEIIQEYNLGLKRNLDKSPAHALGEIDEVLQKLQLNRNIDSYILSGNNKLGARIKLESAGLEKYFNQNRHYLASYSRPRRIDVAKAAITESGKSQCIILGDTPYDIAIAQKIGVQVIAVASGQHSLEELEQLNPTYLLEEPNQVGLFEIFNSLV